jgi:hypothetical protein
VRIFRVTRTYWSDANRILSKVGAITGNNSVPDVILGSQTMTGTNATATTYNYKINPGLLVTDGNILYATDGPRIVGYSQPSSLTTSNQPIDFALGQLSVTNYNVNDGGISASSFSSIASAEFSSGKLLVTDQATIAFCFGRAHPPRRGRRRR